jgi:hypothetical protein
MSNGPIATLATTIPSGGSDEKSSLMKSIVNSNGLRVTSKWFAQTPAIWGSSIHVDRGSGSVSMQGP